VWPFGSIDELGGPPAGKLLTTAGVGAVVAMAIDGAPFASRLGRAMRPAVG